MLTGILLIVVAFLLLILAGFVQCWSETEAGVDQFMSFLTRRMGPGVLHNAKPQVKWPHRTLYCLALASLVGGVVLLLFL